MNTRMLLAAALLAGWAMSVQAAPKAAKESLIAAPAPGASMKSFTDDLDKLKETLVLTDEQAKKIQDLRTERDAMLVKWGEQSQPRIEQLQAKLAKLTAAKDARARTQIEAQIKNANAGRARIADSAERSMFAVLTKEQKGKFNGPALAEEVLQEYAAQDLTDAQKTKVAELCAARAQTSTGPLDAAAKTAAVTVLKKQVHASILTPVQRAAYDKAHKGTTKNPRK